MTPENSSQLITALAALGGVLLTGILGWIGYYLKSRLDLEKEARARHFQSRLEVYERAYYCAAAVYQSGSRPPTLEEVRAIYRGLVMVGSPEVLRAFNLISDTSPEKLRREGGMSEAEIRARQTEVARALFNAIRHDLYPHQKRLNPDDIRFIEASRPVAG